MCTRAKEQTEKTTVIKETRNFRPRTLKVQSATSDPKFSIRYAMADTPTFENQKEESLTTEAGRADNRGPTIEARRADKLKSS